LREADCPEYAKARPWEANKPGDDRGNCRYGPARRPAGTHPDSPARTSGKLGIFCA